MNSVDVWRKLQDVEWAAYKENPLGIFSIPEAPLTGAAKDFIKRMSGGLCLDIGCGCLKLPGYMDGNEHIKFVGIDPFFGDVKRKFLFAQAIGENLPFRNSMFDYVLLMTTLDHFIYPILVLSEIRRVLTAAGMLFIVILFSDPNKKNYKEWIDSKLSCVYDKHHQWAFTKETFMVLMHAGGFVETSRFSLLKGIEGICLTVQ